VVQCGTTEVQNMNVMILQLRDEEMSGKLQSRELEPRALLGKGSNMSWPEGTFEVLMLAVALRLLRFLCCQHINKCSIV
jgi:hypothetical protein